MLLGLNLSQRSWEMLHFTTPLFVLCFEISMKKHNLCFWGDVGDSEIHGGIICGILTHDFLEKL